MKTKNIIIFMLSALFITGLVGCNSQAKVDEADSERIVAIEKKVDELFNKEKTDIIDFTKEQVEEIDELLVEEEGNEFSEDNALRIGSITLYLSQAMEMQAFEGKVIALFDDEGVLVKDASIEGLDKEVESFKNETVFYDRLVEKLEVAENQLVTINEVTDYVDSLFAEGEVKKDVTRDLEKEAINLIGEVSNKEVKEELLAKLVDVDASLSKKEEIALAKKEEEQKQEQARKEEQQKQDEANKQQVAQESSVSKEQTDSNKTSGEKKKTTSSNSNSGNDENKGTASSNNSGSKKQADGSNQTSGKSNNKTTPKDKGSSASKPKADKGSDSSNGSSGMSGQDVADWFNNAECEKGGEGYVDGEKGNTWESFDCN